MDDQDVLDREMDDEAQVERSRAAGARDGVPIELECEADGG